MTNIPSLPNDHVHAHILMDTRFTITSLTKNLIDEQGVDQFDQVLHLTQSTSITFDRALKHLGFSLTPSLFSSLVFWHLLHWETQQARDHWPWTSILISSCLDELEIPSDGNLLVMHGLLGLTDAFCAMDTADERSTKLYSTLGNAFSHVSKVFQSLGDLESAFMASQSARGCFYFTSYDKAIREARNAAEHSADLGPIEKAKAYLSLFYILAESAGSDGASRLEAFDAGERLVRIVLTHRDQLESKNSDLAANALHTVFVTAKENRYLGPLIVPFATEISTQNPLNDEQQNVVSDAAKVWSIVQDCPIEELEERFELMRSWIPEYEEHRLGIIEHRDTNIATASWRSMQFTHTNMQNAVPSGGSLFRMKNAHEYVLTLGHEITHVITMTSGLGLALLAMRIAILEIEIVLCSMSIDPQRHEPNAFFSDLKPWQPPAPSIAALIRIEQITTIERKIQILEDTWSHWYEGIAVFVELGGLPRIESDFTTITSNVISHMIDGLEWGMNPLNTESVPDEFQAQYMATLRRCEEFYLEAVDTIGVQRLRAYLSANHNDYLPGYLAVRAVVSAWRDRTERPINGEMAARMLNNITTAATFNYVPDLSLPIDEFRAETLHRHQQFLDCVSGISEEEIELYREEGINTGRRAASIHWLDGSPKRKLDEDTEQFEEATRNALKSWVLETMRTGAVSEQDTPDPKIEEDIEASIRHSGAVVLSDPKNKPVLDSLHIANGIIQCMSLITLGKYEAPFWLFRQHQHLFMLIRTMPDHAVKNTASYNGLSIPLSEDEYDRLAEEQRRLDTSRITVKRVADIGDPVLGRGSNFLVFQCGDWVKSMIAGAPIGRSGDQDEDNIAHLPEWRIVPNPFFESILSLSAENSPCSLRTLEYIRSSDWFIRESGEEVDVSGWARSVGILAKEVLERPQDQSAETSMRLYEWVTGDGFLARSLCEHGLGTVFKPGTDPAAISAFLQCLHESAYAPVPRSGVYLSNFAEVVPDWFHETPAGWDVSLPSKI